jgi:predicted O-methyltransferase YrrM
VAQHHQFPALVGIMSVMDIDEVVTTEVEQKTLDEKQWTAVDRYINERLVPNERVLDEVMAANAAAELPSIDVAPNQGKLLHLLALMKGARRILEVGTLGGYSTIWLARALPADGRLLTLELQAKHAEVARANVDRAGVGDKVEIRVGAAAELLAALIDEMQEPFDMIFIDADKKNIPVYMKHAMMMSRAGTLIVTDNVVREGAILDEASTDADVQGVRAMFEMMAKEPRLVSTAIQTVGSKGWDGFAMAVVVE